MSAHMSRHLSTATSAVTKSNMDAAIERMDMCMHAWSFTCVQTCVPACASKPTDVSANIRLRTYTCKLTHGTVSMVAHP